jgi:hypothetical protein
MKYGNFRIEIYEHVNNHKSKTSEKKYFYSPLALLDNKSAVSRYNRVTKQQEMRFHVEMWDDKVENQVLKHLNEIVDHEIKSNQVTVIPLKNVILTSNIPSSPHQIIRFLQYGRTMTKAKLFGFICCVMTKKSATNWLKKCDLIPNNFTI